MNKKHTPYVKTTEFANRVQYTNLIIESCVFVLSLIIYINHYQIDKDAFQSWLNKPIIQAEFKGECASDEENFLNFNFMKTSTGCYCGSPYEVFNSSFLEVDQCMRSELSGEQPCTEIGSVQDQPLKSWKGNLLCGKRHEKTYWQLAYEKCAEKCDGACMKSCPQLKAMTLNDTLIYKFELGYEVGYCYEEGSAVEGNYPLWPAATKCMTNDPRRILVDVEDQKTLLEENEFNITTLLGIETFESNQL